MQPVVPHILCLVGLAGVAIACTSLQSNSSPAFTTMPSSTQQSAAAVAPLQAITLIARQEALPPLGAETLERPIGFASVFLNLENSGDRPQILDHLQVKIIAVDNGETQLSSEPQTVELLPLENAVLDIQLNNREGYATEGEVKAIATYRINGEVHRLESTAVEIR